MRLHWFENRKIRTKLVLGFGLAGLALVTAPLAAYVIQSNGEIQTARLEQAGIAPAKALRNVVQLTQQHRGLSSNVLGGNTTLESKRTAKQAEVDRTVEALTVLVKSDIDDRTIAAAWSRVVEQWKTLASGVSSRSITGKESVARHTALIGDTLKLLDLVLDHFGLSLDPSADSYHMVMGTLVYLPNLTESLGQARARGSLYLATKSITPADRASLEALADVATKQHESMKRELDKAMALNPQIKAELDNLIQGSAVAMRKAIDLAMTQVVNAEPLSYAPADYYALFTETIDAQFTLLDQAMSELDTALQARIAGLRSGQLTMLGIIALAIAVAVWMGTACVRSVTGPVRMVVGVVEKTATGDLTARVSADTKDELGQMGQAINRMLDNFSSSLRQVGQAARQASSASQQLAAGSEQLSSGAQGLAASLEETAAALEQITGTVKQNADNAQAANQMAVSAKETAERGDGVVHGAIAAMQTITTSSKRIAEIITTIDEIAFQTNLLALNAAVEAARAGEQGRGFAVVAGEVRALAQRAATASKEIKAIITDSVAKVEEGADLVAQSGTTLTEIVVGIKKVADLIADISAASSEQAQGIDQVNRTITQMDSVTQQTAAQTEELSGTAQTLAAQAEELSTLVAQFTIEQELNSPQASAFGLQSSAISSQQSAVSQPVKTKNKAQTYALAGVSGGNGRSRGSRAYGSRRV